MGFLKKMRAKSEFSSALDNYNLQLAEWEDETKHLDRLLSLVVDLKGLVERGRRQYSVRTKAGEEVLFGVEGSSGLVEPRSSGGSYQGGSSGVSVRVAKGVSFRVGNHKGTYVPGREVQKAIDTGGSFYITTKRVVYTSPSRNREWAYDKTVDVYHTDNWMQGWGVTFMAVSNRQKTSGFAHPQGGARGVRDLIVLGMAVNDGTVEGWPRVLWRSRRN